MKRVYRRGRNSYAVKIELGRDPTTKKRRTKWITVQGTERDAGTVATQYLGALAELRDIAKGERKRKTDRVDKLVMDAIDQAAAHKISILDLPGFLRAGDHSLTAVANGKAFPKPVSELVEGHLDNWLKTIKHQVAPKTHERYAEITRKHLAPALGQHLLVELEPAHVQDYLTQALDTGRRPRPVKNADTVKAAPAGLSPRTVHHHYRILSQSLRHAVELGLIGRNPCDRVRPPRAPRREMAIIDQTQTAALLKAAEGLVIYVPILLAVTTGMRRGEILALRWRDLDLNAASLSVVQSLEQTREGVAFKAPKTARGRRTIVLPALTVEALRRHKVKQAKERLRLGPVWQDNDLVCPRFDGAPMSPREVTKAFVRLARKLKLPIRFHDLRHTHISHLLAAGVHPKVASERAGHASISITLDTYSHVLPGLQEDAARKIDAALRTALEH